MSVAPSAQTSRNLTEKDKSNPSEDFLWDLVGLGEDALIMAAIAAVIFYVPFFVLDAMASDAGLPLATRFISLFYATDEVPTAAAVRSTVVATRASLGRFWISVVKWFQKIGRSCCNPLSWRARMGNFFRTF